MYKDEGVRFADFISFFLNYPMEFGLIKTKLFHFHRIFKNGGGGPPEPPLDPPLLLITFANSLEFGLRTGPTERPSCPGYKPFEILKDFLEK